MGREPLQSATINHKPRMPFRVLGLDLIDVAGVCYLLAPSSPERPFQERGRDGQTHRSIYSHGASLAAGWDRAPSASRAGIARDDPVLPLFVRRDGHDVGGARRGTFSGHPAGARVRPVRRSCVSHDRSVRLDRKQRRVPHLGVPVGSAPDRIPRDRRGLGRRLDKVPRAGRPAGIASGWAGGKDPLPPTQAEPTMLFSTVRGGRTEWANSSA